MPFQPRGRYWDDLVVGEEFWAAGRTVLESDMSSFAALSGDFNPLHMDAEFAKSSAFGERIPHGPLGLMFAMGGIDRTGLLEGVAVAFLDLRWRFVAPLRIGDTARVRLVVQELKPTKAADRGILVLGVELHNQHGEVVQEGQQTFLIQRRQT